MDKKNLSYGQWVDITNDYAVVTQISDILDSWKNDAFRLMQEIEERDQKIRWQEDFIKAKNSILHRVVEVGNYLSMVADNRDSTHEEIVRAILAWRNLVSPLYHEDEK